MTLLTKWSRYW